MKAMRIHRMGDIDELRLEELPDPQPGPGQVRIRVRAASLNYRDLLVVKGLYSRNLALPLIPLSDGAGEVVEVGPGATRFAVGARAAGIFMQTWTEGALTEAKSKSALGGAIDGVLAEQIVLHEDGLVAVPDHLSFEEAATLPCAAVTAWNALVEGGVQAGDSVLTLGTGGVSLFALQFARLAGARVIVTSSSDAKLERAKQLGASDGVNYKTTPEWDKKVPRPDWRRRRRSRRRGRRGRHAVAVAEGGTRGRPRRPDRRADRRRRVQPDAGADEGGAACRASSSARGRCSRR